MSIRPVVRWNSTRQMQVGMACGFRVVDGRLENIRKAGSVEDGDAHYVVAGVRPASTSEKKMWNLLMRGESKWGS